MTPAAKGFSVGARSQSGYCGRPNHSCRVASCVSSPPVLQISARSGWATLDAFHDRTAVGHWSSSASGLFSQESMSGQYNLRVPSGWMVRLNPWYCFEPGQNISPVRLELEGTV